MLNFLKNHPIGVIRGSFFILKTGPFISLRISSSDCFLCAPLYIVRNLYKTNFLPFKPTLFCLKNTGPKDVNFIKIATIKKSGLNIIIPNPDRTTSIALFTKSCHSLATVVSNVKRGTPSSSVWWDFAIFKSNKSTAIVALTPSVSQALMAFSI